ncbi:hypothetical protein AB6A40_001173 [Gnathostoma spinigerum]|uniref:WAP domain-containing protein n=1 Tax=Gnathostoma spinigerum TaxID=75299 RepID=A0ABD6EAU0_9BILA
MCFPLVLLATFICLIVSTITDENVSPNLVNISTNTIHLNHHSPLKSVEISKTKRKDSSKTAVPVRMIAKRTQNASGNDKTPPQSRGFAKPFVAKQRRPQIVAHPPMESHPRRSPESKRSHPGKSPESKKVVHPQAMVTGRFGRRRMVVGPPRSDVRSDRSVIASLLSMNRKSSVKRRSLPRLFNDTLTNNRRKVYPLDDERKLLKKKKKRLRQLRDEVRRLSLHLNAKKSFNGGGSNPNNHLNGGRKLDSTRSRWRKQILARMKSIMKRLRRLESGKNKDIKHEVVNMRTVKKNGKSVSTVHFPGFHPMSSTAMPIIATTTNVKMKRLRLSINQSKSGLPGSPCYSHKDCKPGLCCHRTPLSNGTVSSMCFQHSLQDGEPCEDSCQCQARLICFKTMPSRNAICKEASTEDVVKGVSLNSKDSSFNERFSTRTVR